MFSFGKFFLSDHSKQAFTESFMSVHIEFLVVEYPNKKVNFPIYELTP